MRAYLIAVLCLASAPACQQWTPLDDGGWSPRDDGATCPTPPDMATPPPKCAAAEGLKGDNVLCLDFNGIGALTDQKLAGWDFTTNCGGNFWELSAGKLQIRGFSTFMSTCGFTLPPLTAADYQKYGRFALAVVQRADLNEVEQKAQIMLGADDPSKRLLAQITGKQPRQRNIYEIAKSDLPLTAMGGFQPLFKITSNAMVGTVNAGWQMESIAIQGIP